MSIKVSIIVPAYNAGKTIENSVRSILNQTLSDIEVIAIDDGSNDNTREILEKIHKEDSRVKLIKKDVNEGLSAARNSGMSIAKGTYIGFVDADDWVESGMFQHYYNHGKKEDSDLIIGGYLHETMNVQRNQVLVSRKVYISSCFQTGKKNILRSATVLDSRKLFPYVCNKLYKREIILKNNLLFQNQVLIEDFLFNVSYWIFIDKLTILNDLSYHYIKSSEDALTQKFVKGIFDLANIRYIKMKEMLQMYNYYSDDLRMRAANVYIKHMIAGIVRNCSDKSNYTYHEQYKITKEVFKHHNCIEACKYAKGETRQEKICNYIFKTRSVFLNLLAGKLIFYMQKSSQNIFDKIK